MTESAGSSSVVRGTRPKPIYVQLADLLRADIVTGLYQPHEMIPSELELSRQHGISRMTARGVVTQLVNEGLLYRVQGKGTFVVEPKIRASSLAYRGIREQLESLGYSTDTKLVDFPHHRRRSQLGQVFNVPEGEPLVFAKRLRSADGTPISLHLSYVPHSWPRPSPRTGLRTSSCASSWPGTFPLRPAAGDRFAGVNTGFSRGGPAAWSGSTVPAATPFRHVPHRIGSGVRVHKVLFRGDKVKLQFEYGADR